jgi:SpoVK/Ycf46/Vps4 family AAA+-type ATPase
MCGFHLNDKFWVEGYQCSTLVKMGRVDIEKIGILGHDEAIEEIMSSVFEPLLVSAKVRNELGKLSTNVDYNIFLNRCIDIQAVRGVILHGSPGTGKTSLIRCVSNKFFSFLKYSFISGVYATICKFNLVSSMDRNCLNNLSTIQLAPSVNFLMKLLLIK